MKCRQDTFRPLPDALLRAVADTRAPHRQGDTARFEAWWRGAEQLIEFPVSPRPPGLRSSFDVSTRTPFTDGKRAMISSGWLLQQTVDHESEWIAPSPSADYPAFRNTLHCELVVDRSTCLNRHFVVLFPARRSCLGSNRYIRASEVPPQVSV